MSLSTNLETITLPVHFEDRSGAEFERLCFAYVLSMRDWDTIDWYGQLGGDSGRDIWATIKDSYSMPESYCFQCANYCKLNFDKARRDIDKVICGLSGIPKRFILITGGKVSANMRDRIKQCGQSKGVDTVEVWSGIEFEERLRRDTHSLLLRFCQGITFPEMIVDLKLFTGETIAANDYEILDLMAQCFDRPAFITPFYQESSIPDFKKAITDTIEVLNTGVRRLRDGTLIRRIPSRHDIQDKSLKQTVSAIAVELDKLRAKYDEFVRTDEIRPCGCNNPECPVFFSSSQACRVMDSMRLRILKQFQAIYPEFDVRLR